MGGELEEGWRPMGHDVSVGAIWLGELEPPASVPQNARWALAEWERLKSDGKSPQACLHPLHGYQVAEEVI